MRNALSPEEIDILVSADFPYTFALPSIGYSNFAIVQDRIMGDLGPSAIVEVPVPGRLIEVTCAYLTEMKWALWSKLDGVYRPYWMFFRAKADHDRFLELITRLSEEDKVRAALENEREE